MDFTDNIFLESSFGIAFRICFWFSLIFATNDIIQVDYNSYSPILI